MGLLGNKSNKSVSLCEYEELTINRYNIAIVKNKRKVQLTALFILLKKQFPDAEYFITTTMKTFCIPEEFESAEIMAIASHFEVKEWNVFIDDEHYIDIDMNLIKINGEPKMINEIKGIIKKIERFSYDIDVHSFEFNQYSEWLWEKYLQSQYQTCIELGNKYLKFGDFLVYDDELDEFKIEKEEDFNLLQRKNYILLKSKLDSFRIILIDVEKRIVLATQLDELEKQYLAEILHPDIEK